MSDLASQLYRILECPVCNKLPRTLPVVCCGAGHIICEECRCHTSLCPLCRGSLVFSTNTVAGQICTILQHSCRYKSIGCPITSSVDKIAEHELRCPERTIICAFREDIKTANSSRAQKMYQYYIWNSSTLK